MLAPQDFTVLDGIPVTSVARTILDLAAILRPPDLEKVIDRAERADLLRPQCGVDVLDRANGKKGTRTLKRTLAAYEKSTQKSELERAFKELLKPATDITGPSFNAWFKERRAPTKWTRSGKNRGSPSSSTASSSTARGATERKTRERRRPRARRLPRDAPHVGRRHRQRRADARGGCGWPSRLA